MPQPDPIRKARNGPDPRVMFALWVVPLFVYLGLIGRWSMDTDEIYTYIDSSKPLRELLSYERKPLYYLICHVLLRLDLDVPLEFLLRLPAALAASWIAPTYYGMLHAPGRARGAMFTAILVAANAWLFEMSQFARFYSLAFLFASISTIALYRWLRERRTKWIVLYVVGGVLATLSHTPAAIVFPAGMAAFTLAMLHRDHQQVFRFVRRFGLLGGVSLLVLMVAIWWATRDVITFWYSSSAGQFGDYSVRQLLIALIVFGGISNWALALLPLGKPPVDWRSEDVFLVGMVFCGIVPFLFLVPMGGGVAARYLIFTLPGMFVLAGIHWDTMDRYLPSWGYRFGLGVGILAVNVPYLASVASDGNHFDYRSAAQAITAMELEDPILIAASHQMLQHYLADPREVLELGAFARGVPRSRISRCIQQAGEQHRPLLIVSREDRFELTPEDQDWLYSRFALVRSMQSQRFDHRRFRMSIYRYRGDDSGVELAHNSGDRALGQGLSLPAIYPEGLGGLPRNESRVDPPLFLRTVTPFASYGGQAPHNSPGLRTHTEGAGTSAPKWWVNPSVGPSPWQLESRVTP